MLKTVFLLIASFLVAGCNISLQTEFPTDAAPVLITSTLPPTQTPHPSQTSIPLLSSPTIVPVRGTTSTQVNVRAEPSTAGEVLGIIAANTGVQIVGQDPGGNWWQILYEAGTGGKGWVTAQYVEPEADPEVPVIGGGETGPGSGISAVVIQQLNIRSGPGTSFNSIGVLNANDVVNLTGKNRDGSWLQIEFAGGPDGMGWISAAFVRTDNAENLPIVSDSGEVVGTGTPMNTPPPPTPTIVPATLDFDSADAPLKTILFERAGTRMFIYNGDVSTPSGDTEDWIAFTAYDNLVFVKVECAGNGSLRAEIVGSGFSLSCNEAGKTIPVQAGVLYLIHIEAAPASGALQYINYTLIIKASP